MRLLVLLVVCLSMPALAENMGTISKDSQTLSIVDTYSTFDPENNEVTVHFLPCKYSEKLKLDWRPESGFLKCFPFSEAEYFSAPGAVLSIAFDDEGKVGRVMFSTTQMGDKENRDYQGFSKSWFRNAPIEGQNVKSGGNIKFSASFELPDDAIKVSLNINTTVNDTIEAN